MLGDVVAFNGMLLMFQFPTFAAQFAYSFVSAGLSSARRVLELLNATSDLDQNAAGLDIEMDGSIEFKDVTFQLQRLAMWLRMQGVNFTVKPGQTVAITGQTGAGKSTIIKLLNRTYDVTAGQVVVGGRDVRD
jgi:ATP-binding cassette subfamily B protein